MSKEDNQGALFKNDAMRAGKSDADYTGNITIDGKEYWLNGWINVSRDGNKKYFRLKAKLKSEAKKPQARETSFDEVPF